ncbi:hypothetical protein DSL72_006293 [Monilinia vaccinii-corymbosi]|uniref:Uncharacterized protein n=1 Tax=Monilinia vaccinii-corymbosi TaxID=61207 RepID=A0A8A3PNL3_9HELO|nr:hypothetical protein DSL72_006293 [Monilinia vaccinii-corymbosi]
MFKFIKPRAASIRARLQPNASFRSPLPMRFNAQRHAGLGPNIQAVRFRKAPVKVKNVAITVIMAVVCFKIYSEVVLSPLDDALQEASKDIPEEEFEEVEAPLFIPFPGTTKQLPTIPYQGSDPEFQEFVRISNDPKVLEKIRGDLAELMRNFATRNPVIRRLVGKNTQPMRIRRAWLDIDFPLTPPPSFERSGIEISDEAISWVTQPVDASTVYKIRSVLWPIALFHSSWSFVKVVAAEEFRNIAGMFGVQVQTSPAQQSLEQLLTRSQKLVNEMNEMNGQQKVSGGVQRPLTAKDGPPQQPLGDKSKEIGDATASGKPNEKEDALLALMNSFKDLRSSLAKPIMAARIKYAETTRKLRPKQNLHPRGCIKVSGFVEIEAESAFLLIDVIAAWDPKTQDYHAESMSLVLRRLQKKRQRPVNRLPGMPTR